MKRPPTPQNAQHRRGWLVVVLLAGPVAWFAHLNVSYALVYATCRPWGSWWLHLVTAVAVAAIAAFTGVELRRRKDPTGLMEQTARPAGSGWQFLSSLGWMLGAFFLLVTVMAGLASAMVSPCF
ncbi:hypothetical protein BH23ACT5_BH23ACT5_08130 [soil metagenome]